MLMVGRFPSNLRATEEILLLRGLVTTSTAFASVSCSASDAKADFKGREGEEEVGGWRLESG